MTNLAGDGREFLEFCSNQKGLSANSLRAYGQDISCFNKFAACCAAENRSGPDELVDYAKYLKETKGLSAATIRRRLVTVRAYYRWKCEKAGIDFSFIQNTVIEIRAPKRIPRPIDRDVLKLLLENREPTERQRRSASDTGNPDAFDINSVTNLIVRLLVLTGLRVGELVRLRINDVSISSSRIRVRGKGDRDRTVYLANRQLIDDLKEYLSRRLHADAPDAPLFLNSRSCGLTEPAVRKRLKNTSRRLGISPHLTPHRFRHTAATLLIEEGVDIRFVQRLLGHASISTTEIYTKVSDSSLQKAVENADVLSTIDRQC